MISVKRRKIVCSVVGIGMLQVLAACGKAGLLASVAVDVVVFSYLDHAIFDVYLDGAMIGGSASLPDSPYGQFGTVAGVAISPESRVLTWRHAGTGEMSTAKNPVKTNFDTIAFRPQSLGVHIYPDNTAEFIFTADVLEQSPRGKAYAKKFQVIVG
jgi:hypothetical protein